MKGRLVCVLARMQAERRVVDTAQLPEEEEEEDGAGKDIEDTVPDHLARGVDHVRTLRKSPTDGVGDEHEGEVDGREDVALAELASLGECAARGLPEEEGAVPVPVPVPDVGGLSAGGCFESGRGWGGGGSAAGFEWVNIGTE